MARLEATAPQLISLLDQGQAVEVSVPGFELHLDLIRQLVIRSWVWGELTARDEIERARQSRRQTFADPPPLEWSGPPPNAAIQWLSNRETLLGRWNRDLDAEVTAVLVQSLETGASKAKMMEALSEVFPTFSARRLEMIARTESTAALTQGRLARFRDPDSSVEAVQFVAIMDARVTDICRARDGLIMRLDDERLAYNTPPLHINCRSTLVPILSWDLEDLADGDERLEQRWFGWLKDADAPKNLEEALGKWDKVPAPAKGFGQVGSPKKKPAKKARKLKPSNQKTIPPVDDSFANWLPQKLKTGVTTTADVLEVGSKALADIEKTVGKSADTAKAKYLKAHAKHKAQHEKVRKARMAYLRDPLKTPEKADAINAEIDKVIELRDRANKERAKLAEIRRRSVLGLLESVEKFGGAEQDWASGSASRMKASYKRIAPLLPQKWLETSRDYGPLSAKTLKSGGWYRHSPTPGLVSDIRASGVAGVIDEVLIHELGHRFEDTIPQLRRLLREYLAERTAGYPTQPLSALYPGSGYGYADRAIKDKFTEGYFGRIYPGGATELLSMGLESLWFSNHEVWEKDKELLSFVIGAILSL